MVRWAEALAKIARMILTIKLDWNWSSFQLANGAPPLGVTDSAIAPSARMPRARWLAESQRRAVSLKTRLRRTSGAGGVSALRDTSLGPFAIHMGHPSQRSPHNAPIFRLLLKVAVNGTHQCELLNF